MTDAMVTGDYEDWADSWEEVSEQEHVRLAEAADEFDMLAAAEMDKTEEEQAEAPAEADAVERENEYDVERRIFNHHFAEPAPDPDAGLFRLIQKHDRMVAAGDRRAEALFWELICRDAQTVAGHDAKVAMVAGSKFVGTDPVALAWRLGCEAGRLGLNRPVPGFLMTPGSR